ncbi:MAG TPA: IS91 family transposase [Bacteroidales bacterium]|nr:IS91 family transposase [Bacteroidales bacterium]
MQRQITIGDILAQYGEEYITRHHICGQQKGIIRLLAMCRSQAMGSHFERCDHCNYLGKAFNSCRNRHCPTCQQKDKLLWLNKRMQELLPIGYYHLVFTTPHELNPLCFRNKKVMYDILFKAASQTVLELARDTKHMGADTGLITVLHTWGQNMMEHPHLHCIMPTGGLSFDKQHWVYPSKKNKFFVHVKAISRLFRGKYLDLLQIAFDNNELCFNSPLSPLAGKTKFTAFCSTLYVKEWVVNIQAPLGKPEKVLEYLSRYVFRVAMTDRRIIEVNQGKVHFHWKNYRTGLYSKMKLDIDEFIRRYLLHVLPTGFFKVRYYGIFSSRYRKQNIQNARELLIQDTQLLHEQALEDGRQVWIKQDNVWKEILTKIQNHKKPNCPLCQKGRLLFAGRVARAG